MGLILLGFNPWWDTEFEFEVVVPELALVRFVVEDYDASSKNDFIGQSTIPLGSLKQGECMWRGGDDKVEEAEPLSLEASSPNDWNFLCVLSCPSPLPGYRHVHLLSKNGDQHPSATLFVKVYLQD